LGIKILVLVAIFLIPLFIIPVFGQEVPSWIKNNAKWWSEGTISNQEFISSIEYLIAQGVIDEEVTKPASASTDNNAIPSWIKTTAEYWADGKITDTEFLNTIEYLIVNGMIGTTNQQVIDISDSFSIEKSPTKIGLEIISTNNDSNIHTVTSGNLVDGPDGIFDSSLLVPGQTSSIIGRITQTGTFDYFCMVHPWEQGTITVDSDDLKIYYAELEKQKEIERQVLAEQEAEIQRNKAANDIKSKFLSSTIESLSAEPTEKDLEDFRVFLGEELNQKIQDFNEKYETGFSPETPLSMEIDMELTLEEEFLIIELAERWLEFFKQKMSERIIQIDNSFEEAKRQINELELVDEEKLQHIKEIEEEKIAYVSGFTKGMKNLILLEDEITQKKRELQLEAELHGKSLEFDSSICGEGTEMKNGQCVPTSVLGGGCLIATATFGSELAPQVQMLREIRDNSLLQTQSGQSFMQGFTQFYYSFSPIIADYERQNPVFKEAVKLTITPLLASLSLLNYVDLDSEESVLGYGIGIILMNVGMYFVAPALLVIGIYRKHSFFV